MSYRSTLVCFSVRMAVWKPKPQSSRCIHRCIYYPLPVHTPVQTAMHLCMNLHQTGTNMHKSLSAFEKPNGLRGARLSLASAPDSIPAPPLPRGLHALARPLSHSGYPLTRGTAFRVAIVDLRGLSREPRFRRPRRTAP
jgi:hypothetical protein